MTAAGLDGGGTARTAAAGYGGTPAGGGGCCPMVTAGQGGNVACRGCPRVVTSRVELRGELVITALVTMSHHWVASLIAC
ncbi:hypothetical protein HXX76_002307 [Chlamydomonas incerta]|uniref:Uncharacterized protein n=1 Tax=Chlamydomonas incerta TaxID=51695 RepID=A0A835SME3_CHLIN|nr:hypothetical protein HXX76_002307 [Chlamydomonas incerta]|eukprot:KAG2423080.1 hypothetical protein HXX76_002307 [Chlamydomonas incerta]